MSSKGAAKYARTIVAIRIRFLTNVADEMFPLQMSPKFLNRWIESELVTGWTQMT